MSFIEIATMCGIAGRYNFVSGAPVEAPLLQNMCKMLVHRGPDGEGIYQNGPLGFGHRRLAVIDLSPAAHQPMVSDNGRLCITYNGEVYNYQELRSLLKSYGYHFRSNSDTEVVLTAYRHYGVQCLQFLKGMFAFAIWDSKERTLFLARDRVGKKPLYYSIDTEGIAFASEPKAFLPDPNFKAEVNLEAISHYLSHQYIPSPLSAFKGVQKLNPAHYLLVKEGKVTIERYWSLSYKNSFVGSEEDATQELIAKFRRAVKSRLISDVPLGAFLSGGIDSSLTVALMSELGVRPLKTFSIGFEHNTLNELPYARMVASHFGTAHEELVVSANMTDIIPKLVWHYNEPYADSSALATYYVSQLARKHVTVVLTGDGSDENLAGYNRYRWNVNRRQRDVLWKILRAARPMSDWLLAHTPHNQWLRKFQSLLADRELTHQRAYAHSNFHFSPSLKSQCCTEEFLQESGNIDSADYIVKAYMNSDAVDSIDGTLDVDVHTYLLNDILVKVDIASMANGLEARSPFLDQDVMEFCASLPSHMKLRENTHKFILKKSAQDFLPQEIIHRPKKGFEIPIAHWFKHDIPEMVYDVILSSRALNRGYFRKHVVKQLVNEHMSGTRIRHKELWNLLMLELWHETYIDEPDPARHHVSYGVG